MAILDLITPIGASSDGNSPIWEYQDAGSAGWLYATEGRRGDPVFRSGYLFRQLYSSYTTLCAGAAFKFAGAFSTSSATYVAPFINFYNDSGHHVGIELLSSNGSWGFLNVTDAANVILGTGTTMIRPNEWHYVEFKVTIGSGTDGSFEVRLNGVQEIVGNAKDTYNTGAVSANRVSFYTSESQTAYWQDGYITDGNFLGDIRVDAAFVNADGTYSDFIRNTGTNDWDAINEIYPSTTEYLYGDTQNHKSTFLVAPPSVGTTIYAVQWQFLAGKSGTDARSIAPLVISDDILGTETLGTSYPLNAQQNFYQMLMEVDPADSQPWTDAKITNSEFGFKVTV